MSHSTDCRAKLYMLSDLYRNIQLFRFSAESGEIYIFAGEELQIIIPQNGRWRFVDET
ncbi:DUF6888 family protein [Phormidesmis priestleyi]